VIYFSGSKEMGLPCDLSLRRQFNQDFFVNAPIGFPDVGWFAIFFHSSK